MEDTTNNAKAVKALFEILSSQAIVVKIDFVDMFKSYAAAILLGDLLYQTRVLSERGRENGEEFSGWILMPLATCYKRTRLSEREQERGRAALLDTQVIEYKKMGVPGLPHYKIDFAVLSALAVAWDEERKTRLPVGTKRPNKLGHLPVGTKRPNKLGQNVLTNSIKTLDKNNEENTEAPQGEKKITAVIPDSLRGMSRPSRTKQKAPPAHLSPPAIQAVLRGSGKVYLTRAYTSWLLPELDNAIGSGAVTLEQIEERTKTWCLSYMMSNQNPKFVEYLVHGPSQRIATAAPAKPKSAIPEREMAKGDMV